MGKGHPRILQSRVGIVAVALVAIALLLVNPVGFVGAGNDDFKYLTAARCWIDTGEMCLASNHWETRWPIFAPLAATLALVGEGRTAVSLSALPYWIAAISMTGWVAHLLFSRGAGLWAGAIFASIPVVTWFALRPNADLPELTFQLAAIGSAITASRRGAKGWAVIAGVATGLAIATRETSLLFLIISLPAWWLAAPGARRLIGWAILGLALAVGAEWAAYMAATDDPWARYELAVGHGGIPSAYLKEGVDISRSPILNPEFIAGWIRPMGIEVWWPIDAWLNLFADPLIGMWLIAGLIAAAWRVREGRPEEKGALLAMLLTGGILAGGLVYALAVDPRPRMFMLPAAFCAIALGRAIDVLWTKKRQPLATVVPVALILLGALVLSRQSHTRPAEQAARTWIAEHGDAIEIDRQTGEMLSMVSEAQGLAIAPAGRPLRMTFRLEPCAEALADELAENAVSLVGEQAIPGGASLCLLRYEESRAD